MFIVFDLDGTLANVDHRRHFVDGPNKDWHAFFEACDEDLPNWPAIHVFKNLRDAGHTIHIWSGRSEAVFAKTIRWLTKYGISNVPLRMRHAGDFTTTDVKLKRGWLVKQEWLGQALPRPDLAFDDRDGVVAMWRDNGVPCFQVAPGNF